MLPSLWEPKGGLLHESLKMDTKQTESGERACVGALKILLVLNLFDLISTMYLFLQGRVREANPIMDSFIQNGPLAFSLSKIALVYFGVFVLWMLRRQAFAQRAAFAMMLMYVGILFIHLRIIFFC